YAEFYTRARRLASALAKRGITRGDTDTLSPRVMPRLASALAKRGITRGDSVSVMLANTPAMLECHYGVPMTQGVLNTLNTRLDAAILAFSLDHAGAKVVIVDREFSKVMKDALALAKVQPLVIDYDDKEFTGA